MNAPEVGLLRHLVYRAGRAYGRMKAAALRASMPRLMDVQKRKRSFGKAVCRVTHDGGRTWAPWPGPEYGTGRE